MSGFSRNRLVRAALLTAVFAALTPALPAFAATNSGLDSNSNSLNFSLQGIQGMILTGTPDKTAGTINNVNLTLSGHNPTFQVTGRGQIALELNNLGSAVDQKISLITDEGGIIGFGTLNDAQNVADEYMQAYRNTGTYKIAKVEFPAGYVQADHGLIVFGNTPFPVGTAALPVNPNWWGGSPEIVANGDNHAGGGIAISDDGGFYDYNDSWVTFNGVTGLKIAGTNGPASTGAQLMVLGYVYANGYFHLSDARMKDDIQTASGLELVDRLRGVTFKWKKDGKPSMGVIAQEVEQVAPSAVTTGEDGHKMVEYDQLIAPMIEAIKQLKAKVDAQQAEIDDLKARLAKP